MADTKITALTALTGADPANDVIPIVDVSDTTMAASGTTKKISVNNILGASGTATLASATITGDLTVDTSTLKVDSANNRVGIGTASPTATLHVSSAGSVHINQRTGGNGCFTQYVDPVSSNYVGTDSGNFRVANNSAQDLLNIQQLGVFSFGDGAGGTRMTLNSTGLGVGVSPSYKIHSVVTSGYAGAFRSSTAVVGGILCGNTVGDLIVGVDASGNGRVTSDTSKYLGLGSGGINDRVILDSTGNVGIGVTPTTKLDVLGSGDGELRLRAGSDAALIFSETAANKNWKIKPSGGDLFFQYSATAYNSGYSLLMSLTAAGNLGIGVSAFGTSAAKVLGLANATAPSTSPAGMGQLYVEAGALKYRGSSGTITTIANA